MGKKVGRSHGRQSPHPCLQDCMEKKASGTPPGPTPAGEGLRRLSCRNIEAPGRSLGKCSLSQSISVINRFIHQSINQSIRQSISQSSITRTADNQSVSHQSPGQQQCFNQQNFLPERRLDQSISLSVNLLDKDTSKPDQQPTALDDDALNNRSSIGRIAWRLHLLHCRVDQPPNSCEDVSRQAESWHGREVDLVHGFPFGPVKAAHAHI